MVLKSNCPENGIRFCLDISTGYYKSDTSFDEVPDNLKLIRNLNVGNNRPCYFVKEQDIKSNSFNVPLFATGYPLLFKGHCLQFDGDNKRKFHFLLFYFTSDFKHLTVYTFRKTDATTTHWPETMQDALIKSLINKINKQPIYQLND